MPSPGVPVTKHAYPKTPEQVQANEAYRLLPMPVPAVLVTLHGAEGGLLLDEDTGKEVGTSVRER